MNPILHKFLQVKCSEVNHTIHESLQKLIPSEGIFAKWISKIQKRLILKNFTNVRRNSNMKGFTTFEGIISKGFKLKVFYQKAFLMTSLKNLKNLRNLFTFGFCSLHFDQQKKSSLGTWFFWVIREIDFLNEKQ